MLQVSLELPVIVADYSLGGVVEPVSNIVCAFGYALQTVDVVTDESLAIGTETFQLLCIKSPVLDGAVVPLLVLEQ